MRATWKALVVGMIVGLLSGLPSSASTLEAPLVSHGQSEAVIVAAQNEFDRFVAAELQRYFDVFTGATFEIVTPEEARRRPSRLVWLLVGGPRANELVREAAVNELVDFENLKTDGFIL